MVEATGNNVKVWLCLTIPKVSVEVNENYKEANSALEDEACDMVIDLIPASWGLEIEEVEVGK